MAKISVIIPVYNTATYLPNCLESLLRQTFKDFEAICIDDGSIDECRNILQQYKQKDKRIKVLTQENKGQGAARNNGLDHASGEYIFFLDSDDMLPNYALSVLWEVAQKTKAPVVVSRKWLDFPLKEKHFVQPKIRRNTFKDFVEDVRIFSSPWNKLYRADILKKNRFIRGIYFEDWPFLTTLFDQINFYVSINTPCYVYNRTNCSTIRSPFHQKKVDGYIAGIWFVYNFFKNRPTLSLARKRIAVAVKMMSNKVYRTKDKTLAKNLFIELDKLFKEGIIRRSQLPLKTRFRLWKMQHMK